MAKIGSYSCFENTGGKPVSFREPYLLKWYKGLHRAEAQCATFAKLHHIGRHKDKNESHNFLTDAVGRSVTVSSTTT